MPTLLGRNWVRTNSETEKKLHATCFLFKNTQPVIKKNDMRVAEQTNSNNQLGSSGYIFPESEKKPITNLTGISINIQSAHAPQINSTRKRKDSDVEAIGVLINEDCRSA